MAQERADADIRVTRLPVAWKHQRRLIRWATRLYSTHKSLVSWVLGALKLPTGVARQSF